MDKQDRLEGVLRMLDAHGLVVAFLSSVSYDHTALLDFLMSEETPFLNFLLEYLQLAASDWEGLREACRTCGGDGTLAGGSNDSRCEIQRRICGSQLGQDEDTGESSSEAHGDEDTGESPSEAHGDEDTGESPSEAHGDEDTGESPSEAHEDTGESSSEVHGDEDTGESPSEAHGDEDNPINVFHRVGEGCRSSGVKRIKLSVNDGWLPEPHSERTETLDSVIGVFIRLKYALLRLDSKMLLPPMLDRLIPLLEYIEDLYEAA